MSLAAAAVYGLRCFRSLLSTDADRVAVLEVIVHIASERNSDRVRVPRVSRRGVTEVHRVQLDHPPGQPLRAVTASDELRTVRSHGVHAVQNPTFERGALSLEEVLEIDEPERRSPEEGPVAGHVAG